jgi:hypothetical protein
MNDPCVVGRREAVGDLRGDVADALDGHTFAALEHRRDALALEELHHDVRGAIGELAEVGDVHDVRVADARSRTRFLEETLQDLLVARHVGAQHLHRDLLRDDLVARAVDDAHPAFADHLFDLVAMIERGPEVRILGLRRALARRFELGGGRDLDGELVLLRQARALDADGPGGRHDAHGKRATGSALSAEARGKRAARCARAGDAVFARDGRGAPDRL